MQAVCPAVLIQEHIMCVCAPVSCKAMPIYLKHASAATLVYSLLYRVYCHVVLFPKCLSFLFQPENKS